MASPPSAFAPFGARAFLVLWIATVVGNIGGWVRDTGSAWLMTELAPSPVMVALVQAAATLPVFVLSLPAGALADIVDRRRMMILIQAGLAAVTLVLAIATASGAMTPGLLLALTFLAGAGAALSGPVWQSIVPELVPRSDLRPAVALNSLGINISRAIGPAIGGGLILSAGIAATYWFDLATYAVTIAALVWWKREAVKPAHPEHLGGAMQAGLRYAIASLPLRRVLLRATLFLVPASCYWALLPLISRNEIGGGAAVYGILLAAVGAGAVAGALLLPRLRQRFSAEALSLGGAFATALATGLLAMAASPAQAALVMAFAGAAWITALTSLNSAAQSALPNWVRGRGLAVYLTVFFGAMTAGSLAWGQFAAIASLDAALVAAAASGLVSLAISRAKPLPTGDDDMSPAQIWPSPAGVEAIDDTSGPIMVTVAYRIERADHDAFAAAAERLGAIRRRDGAYAWGLMRDAADGELVTEWFMVASWEEHLRQHDRAVAADAAVVASVRTFHRGDGLPAVRHLVPLGHLTPAGARTHLAHDEKVAKA
ncbi:MAG: MFS transporter [Hyphomicrobium sp.]|nr:MFS transporter [Hyphomicrobium sp.]